MANLTWKTATSGNWSDISQWVPSGAPDTGDNAFITTDGSYTVTLDDDFSPENLTFDDTGGILDIGAHQLGVDISTTFTAGTITMEGGAFFVGGNGMVTSAGATLIGWGTVNDAITGAGTVVAASNHTLELVDEVTDPATQYDIQANASLQVDDLSANNVTFSLLNNTGNVAFQDNADFDRSTISGLVAGNSTNNATANYVDLPFLDFDTVTVELISGGTGTAGEVFVNYNMGQSRITFDLANVVANGHPWQVEASPDDNGGTEVFLASVCYAAGTRILTANGEVPVEALAEGCSVMTVVGDELLARPIKWVGRRRIDLAAHPRPTTVSPIRIRRDAFAQSVPHHDLLVSPDHGILVDGKLICARQLVNGTTIQQETDCTVVEYFHVELDSHAILLAEGLTAESYLDTGNRGFFVNGDAPLLLHPDLTDESDYPTREQASCAPFVSDEASVRPVWLRLADRAAELGQLVTIPDTTDDPELRVVIGSRAIRPVSVKNGRFVFVVPQHATEMRLVSRAASPTVARPWLEDRRNLGVYVSRIVLRSARDVQELPMDHPSLARGWWAVERAGQGLRRWTDGDATLPLPALRDPAILEVHVAGMCSYPVEGSLAAA